MIIIEFIADSVFTGAVFLMIWFLITASIIGIYRMAVDKR